MPRNVQAQSEWVARVLGLRVDGRSPTASSHQPVVAIWSAAKDTVDARLDGLAKKLRSFKLDALNRVADEGLHGVREAGPNAALTAALFEYDSAAPAARGAARARLQKQIEAWEAALATDMRIGAVDRNPLGVKVDMGRLLGIALRDIKARAAEGAQGG